MNTNKRNTIQRGLVLDAVRSMPDHPTSAEVYDRVRMKHPSISRATVYRNLAVLTESGEITRVKTPGGADHYDCRDDAHFHGICRECGAVCDIDAPVDLGGFDCSDAHGFKVEGCEIVFTGLCAECANLAAAAEHPGDASCVEATDESE